MSRWSIARAEEWHRQQPWLVGCNYIPSTAINQLEMWQADTYDPETIDRELRWAQDLGFNTLRVYLHDLVWATDQTGFAERIEDFLALAARHDMKVLVVFFDDCHSPDPAAGPQPLPVAGVHNSGWKRSPGQKLVSQFNEGAAPETEKARLKRYVQGVLARFSGDERILMWDVYNEAGGNYNGDITNALLEDAWSWAREAQPTQPLTACLEGAAGVKNLATNAAQSDIITFHRYEGDLLEKTILEYKDMYPGRPLLCTEYMARELGTTFQHSLPIFKKHGIGCYCWGLAAGKTQTIWNWHSKGKLKDPEASKILLKPGDAFPEPPLWFHDILRADGRPFDPAEVDFIKRMTR